jgi:hypothetical protein
MTAPEQATQRRTDAVVSGPDPSPPGPGPAPEQDGALDLQTIRLTIVTARPLVDQLLDGEWQSGEWSGGAMVLDQVLDGLTKALDEVEHLRHEVATREAAARHALDAANRAREWARQIERAARAYLVTHNSEHASWGDVCMAEGELRAALDTGGRPNRG